MGERKSYSRVQGFLHFPEYFTVPQNFLQVLQQKALNLFFFKLYVNTIIPCSKKIKEITDDDLPEYIFYKMILL